MYPHIISCTIYLEYSLVRPFVKLKTNRDRRLVLYTCLSPPIVSGRGQDISSGFTASRGQQQGSLDYTTTWSQPGSHSRLLQHCTCDVWSLKRRISSLEGLIRSNPTQRLLLGTGIGDSYSGLQQVPWLGVSHFVMRILPTEAQP